MDEVAYWLTEKVMQPSGKVGTLEGDREGSKSWLSTYCLLGQFKSFFYDSISHIFKIGMLISCFHVLVNIYCMWCNWHSINVCFS